jgi:hypothetical protein
MAKEPLDHRNDPDAPGGYRESGNERTDRERDHLYEQHRGEGGSPVQGRDYGRVRGPDGQNPDQVIQGGEDHSYGGYGSDYVRNREEFGGGGPPSGGPGDEYAPGTKPGKGSGVGAMGQGGAIRRPGEDHDGQALAPDEHPGYVQPDGERRRPD